MTKFVSSTALVEIEENKVVSIGDAIAAVSDQLVPSDDQAELASALRSGLSKKSSELTVRAVMETAHGFDAETWSFLIDDLGVGALALPETLGGAGATFAEVLVVSEELGRALACVPWMSHVVLSQTLLSALEPTSAVLETLSAVATGERRACVAVTEELALWNVVGSGVVATQINDGWRLSGRKEFVIDGASADLVLVLVSTDVGIAVFAVDGGAPGLKRVESMTMDLTRKQATLTFDDVPGLLLSRDAGPAFAQMLDAAAAAMAAECVGGADVVLETAVDYAKTRVQFGRAIGSFQAIKHKCADMLLEVESARSALWYARGTVSNDEGTPSPLAASIAKSTCGDAYLRCAEENIQIHGGIGFTWEHSAHLYYKRARSNSLMFGSSREHRAQVARLLSL